MKSSSASSRVNCFLACLLPNLILGVAQNSFMRDCQVEKREITVHGVEALFLPARVYVVASQLRPVPRPTVEFEQLKFCKLCLGSAERALANPLHRICECALGMWLAGRNFVGTAGHKKSLRCAPQTKPPGTIQNSSATVYLFHSESLKLWVFLSMFGYFDCVNVRCTVEVCAEHDPFAVGGKPHIRLE